MLKTFNSSSQPPEQIDEVSEDEWNMVVDEAVSDVYVEDSEDVVEEFSLSLEESEELYPCEGIDRDRKCLQILS